MLFIGICGASSSGKTTLGKKIQELLGKEKCFLISQDNFYKPLPETEDATTYNFDNPHAIDFTKLKQFISKIMKREECQLPYYDFNNHKVTHNRDINFSGCCVILEGIFSLYDADIREIMNLKLFVDTDLDICLIRRIKRDTLERGRSIESILSQYIQFVKPSFYKYIVEQKQHSDIIIPNGGENVIANDMIKKYIFSVLKL